MALFIRSTPIVCDASSHSCGLYQRAHRKHNWGRPKKANPTCKETTRNEIFTRAPIQGATLWRQRSLPSPLFLPTRPHGARLDGECFSTLAWHFYPRAHMGHDSEILRHIADHDSAKLDQCKAKKQNHRYIDLP